MNKYTRTFIFWKWVNPLFVLFFTIALLFSCKTQKDAVTSKDGKQTFERATVVKDLNEIIDPSSALSNGEKKALLKAIQDHGFGDPQLDSLTLIAANSIRDTYYATNDQNDMDSPEIEITENEPVSTSSESPKIETLQTELNTRFKTLAENLNKIDSEKFIDETLMYFESSDAPVLIILQKSGDKTYFDRPTTIEKYLYYIVDMKNTKYQIESVGMSEEDKINKLVLASK